MRLLLYSWNANNEQILADNLIKSGFEVIWFHKECKHYTRDMELAMEMIPFIHEQGAEAVVSFNYFPIISLICNTCQIPYYAWVFDCPHFTLYAKQITMPCNHIGIFDREMVRQLEKYGVNTVYHVPLAVDTEYFKRVIAQAPRSKKRRYQSDISFVGSLYTGEYNYYDALFHVDFAEREENYKNKWENGSQMYDDMDEIVEKQCFSYQKDYLRQAVTTGGNGVSVFRMQMEEHGLMLGEDYFAKTEDILLSAVLEKKVTVEERRILLTEIIKRFGCHGNNVSNIDEHFYINCDFSNDIDKKYNFKLYTNSDLIELPRLAACNHGVVDYNTQMPLVFSESKINLNISLRSIHSGIPLRVLDIMACGGFVLSNWQPEIEECFVEGVEVVTFVSVEDCLEKIAYYLSHEEKRRQIALNGQRKVGEAFSYRIGFERFFN